MTDNQDSRDYVSTHREDLHYALHEGDRWVRTVVLAALDELAAPIGSELLP